MDLTGHDNLQCEVCGSFNLIPDEAGGYVCEDCDTVVDFRAEELDEYVPGTVRKNRESQVLRSSQIQSSLKVKTPARSREPAFDNNIVLREAIVSIVKAQVQYLVDSEIAPKELKAPVWNIMSHYLTASRVTRPGSQPFLLRLNNFRLSMTLVFLALAAIYIRCPLLPRDLVNLVCTGKLPYIHAASEHVNHKVLKRRKLKALLTPVELPAVAGIIQRAILLVTTEDYRWPPLRHFFFLDYERYHVRFRAFPVGNAELVLLRMLEHARLPKTLYPRILRYRELRRSAGSAMLQANGRNGIASEFTKSELLMHDDPANEELRKSAQLSGKQSNTDNTRTDSDQSGDRDDQSFLQFRATKLERPIFCCAVHDTDYTCIGDIINTFRICYADVDSDSDRATTQGLVPDEETFVPSDLAAGQAASGFGNQERASKSSADRTSLQAELANFEATLKERQFCATNEDLNVHWTNLTPPAVRGLRGRKLREYVHLSESSERQELPVQHAWNESLSFFRTIAEQNLEIDESSNGSTAQVRANHERVKSGSWLYSDKPKGPNDLFCDFDDKQSTRNALDIKEDPRRSKKLDGVHTNRETMNPSASLAHEKRVIGFLISELLIFFHGTKAPLKNRTPLDKKVLTGLHIAIDQSMALVLAYADLYLDGRAVLSHNVPHPFPKFEGSTKRSPT